MHVMHVEHVMHGMHVMHVMHAMHVVLVMHVLVHKDLKPKKAMTREARDARCDRVAIARPTEPDRAGNVLSLRRNWSTKIFAKSRGDL